MSLKKNFLKTKPVCKVTFSLPEAAAQKANKVELLGDFNEWKKKKAIPMVLKNGAFSAKVDLPVGREFQFRYLINGRTWENDWAADAYYPNPFGQENSVVSVFPEAQDARKSEEWEEYYEEVSGNEWEKEEEEIIFYE